MSREYYARYAIERAAREAIESKLAADIAEKLLKKYQSKLEGMIAKSYRGYIPNEMRQLESDLDSVRQSLIDNNPRRARDAAQRVGTYIGSLEVIANTTIAQYERAERLRSEQAKKRTASSGNSLLDIYYNEVGAIEDPVVASIAAPALEEIRAQIESRGTDAFTEAALKAAVAELVKDAEAQAEEYKAEQAAKQQRACLNSQIEDVDLLVKESSVEDEDAAAGFATRIANIRQALESGDSDVIELSEEIASLNSDLEKQAVSEETRREAVRAIYRQLKSQEFTVERPKRISTNGSDFVRIVARRPSGKQAVCEIESDGSIRYRFDQYEAMTCMKDIEKFNVDLESIYSLKLSDERVLWSNPDRLTKDANRVENDDRRTL